MILDDASDLMSILEDGADLAFAAAPARSNSEGLASPSESAPEGQGIGGSIPTPVPSDLSWAEYVIRLKETFIKARPLDDVASLAASMGFRDWMDYVIKLLPKDVKIESNVNFRAMIDGLGPIDVDRYRYQQPQLEESVVDVEGTLVETI